jgi:hypothetical protein
MTEAKLSVEVSRAYFEGHVIGSVSDFSQMFALVSSPSRFPARTSIPQRPSLFASDGICIRGPLNPISGSPHHPSQRMLSTLG